MKRQLAMFISACMLMASVNLPVIAADSKVASLGEGFEFSIKPYENEYGLMANAAELSERFSLEYEFDKENKVFIIYDDNHGEIMLMHNATEFYSGDRVYQCQPYFYVENGVPMIEVGFFCDMFMSSYEYDEKTGEISFNIGKMRHDVSKVVKDGNVIPMYITPFYDICGLMVSAEDMAKAFGVSYEFDGNNAVIDGVYEFADRAPYFMADGEEIEYYPSFKAENGMGFFEAGFFTDLFGYSYVYDEETHTLTIVEKAALAEEESSVVSGIIQHNGTLESDMTVEILIQQTKLKKEGIPTYGGTVGEVYKLGEAVLTPSTTQAEYSFDVSAYASEEYATYTLFYRTANEGGYYARSGGVVPMNDIIEENVQFYPLAQHFYFTSAARADMKIGKLGIIEGKIYPAGGSEVIDESLDVNLVLKGRTTTRHNYYGQVTYNIGSSHDLGTIHFDKGDIDKEYSYETAQYYDVDYPSYMIMYSLNTESENIYPEGYYNTSNMFTPIYKNLIYYNNKYQDVREFSMNEYVVTDLPLITTSGKTGDIEWSLNRTTGVLSIKGSGDLMENMPWASYKNDITTVVMEGDFAVCENAFKNYSILANVEVNGEITTLGPGAFYGCSSLTGIELACDIIADNAFENCKSLKQVTLSDGLMAIGNNAFSGCSSLESIDIPSSVSTIGNKAFYNCSALGGVVLPEELFSIGDAAFSGCLLLKEVKIPHSVVSLGEDAFASCTSLQSAELGNGIEELRDATFMGCVALKSIIVPDNVKTIGAAVFNGCSQLETVVLPEGLTIMGINVFMKCTALKDINIPESITAIPYGTFRGCTNITDIKLPENLNVIDAYAFSGCTGITSITIPEGVNKIGQEAFAKTSITEIVIPDSVSELSTGLFYNCKQLKTVKLNNTMAKLPNMTFEGCEALEEITIPKAVRTIGTNAFSDCTGLKSIIFEGEAPDMAEYAFWGVSGITVYYPMGDITYEEFKKEYSQFTWIERAIMYTISFDANGGTGEIPDQMKYEEKSLTLTDKIPEKLNHTFIGWSEDKDAADAQYQPGEIINENKNMLLYAVWKTDILPGVVVTESADNNNRTITVTMSETYENASVWIAIYNESGRLLSTHKEEIKNEVQLVIEKSNEQYKCSAMIWDAEMKPMRDREMLILNDGMY